MRRTWAPDAWLRLTAVLPRPRARGAVMMFAVLILNTCQGRAVCRWRCECTRIATVEATALRTSTIYRTSLYTLTAEGAVQYVVKFINWRRRVEFFNTNRNRRPAHMAREVDGQKRAPSPPVAFSRFGREQKGTRHNASVARSGSRLQRSERERYHRADAFDCLTNCLTDLLQAFWASSNSSAQRCADDEATTR